MTNGTRENERRQSFRKKPSQLVYVELDRDNGGMMLTASEEGFSFRAVAKVRKNGPIHFAFALDGVNRIEGTGDLLWTAEDGKTGALRFSDMEATCRAQLSAWINDGDAQPPSRRHAAPPQERPTAESAATPRQLNALDHLRKELRRKPGQPPAPEVLAPPAPPAQPPSPPPVSKKSVLQQAVITSDQVAQEFSGADEFEVILPHHAEPAPPTPEEQSALAGPAVESVWKKSAGFRAPKRRKERSAFMTPPRPAPIEAAAPTAAAPPPTRPLAAPSFAPSFAAPATHVQEAPPLSGRQWPTLEPLPDFSATQASPRLSRAAAGVIIGLSLVVVIGAVLVSFRQELGGWLVGVGQTLSGSSSQPAAPPTPETKPSQTTAQDHAAANPASDSGANSQQPAQGANSPLLNAPPSGAAENSATPGSGAHPSTGATDGSQSAGDAANHGAAAQPLARPPANVPAADPQDLTAASFASGESEFAAAREILRGPNRTRDISEAVRLLWAAVQKGYAPAAVLLGELYQSGEGVGRSCDQAKILYSAAAKRGNQDAQVHLNRMYQQVCP